MLKWAGEHGCPWNATTCAGAAWGGHLDVLQWTHANGCPWDAATRRVAKGRILEWAIAIGVPE
ncbi:hypothetical protein N9F40_01745 [bacterium]|nr:hypothetical protein [bacterium]